MLIVARLLAAILLLIGFVIGVIYHLIKGALAQYFDDCSLSIDKLGNVVCGPMFNILFVKPGGYPYGRQNESISYATGRNVLMEKLTEKGIRFNKFLDFWFGKDHSTITVKNYEAGVNAKRMLA